MTLNRLIRELGKREVGIQFKTRDDGTLVAALLLEGVQVSDWTPVHEELHV